MSHSTYVRRYDATVRARQSAAGRYVAPMPAQRATVREVQPSGFKPVFPSFLDWCAQQGIEGAARKPAAARFNIERRARLAKMSQAIETTGTAIEAAAVEPAAGTSEAAAGPALPAADLLCVLALRNLQTTKRGTPEAAQALDAYKLALSYYRTTQALAA